MSSSSVSKLPSQPDDEYHSDPSLAVEISEEIRRQTQLRASRRFFLPVAGGLFAFCTLCAAAIWWQYQATHVVTRNALVRSDLSQLGVRGEGVVAEILVRAGDRVRRGDLLVRLDDRHLLAQRKQTRARIKTLDERIAVNEVSLALAKEKARVGLDQAEAELRETEAQAEAARVRAEDSRAFHAARKALASDGAISAEVIRDAAAKAEVSESLAVAADAAAARSYSTVAAARLAEVDAMILEGELRILRAQREELLAVLDQVELDIENMRVTAPADGAIVRRLVQPGMAVETGTPMLSMWLTDETWIEAWVPEERVGDLAVGSPVTVTFPATPHERFTGRVERIGLATDFEMPADYLPQTREARMRPTPQIGVRVSLEASPAIARPGMSALVDIRRDGV